MEGGGVGIFQSFEIKGLNYPRYIEFEIKD
jgi:hypothetical protein